MEKSNSQIVREYIEVVGNQKQFERMWDYLSRDCIEHRTDYVGVGFVSQDINLDGHSVVIAVFENGPAAGKILVGDELVRARDDKRTWENAEELKGGSWGRGLPGTNVTITLKRNGEMLELPFVRGWVRGLTFKISEMMNDAANADYLKEWPDIKEDIQVVLEQGDLVAFYGINRGTNAKYQRTVVYGECMIFRLKEGKIVEMWGVTDNQAMIEQLGYRISLPEIEKL